MEKLNEGDAAYIAGFIDGEGTITMKNDGRLSKPNCVLRIGIANTNKNVLKWISSKTNNGSLQERKVYSKISFKGKKPCYGIEVHGYIAVELLKQILPYIKVKRRQAKVAIEYGKTLHGVHKKKPSVLTDETVRIRQVLRKRMIELNK